jgi:hypothetical protein
MLSFSGKQLLRQKADKSGVQATSPGKGENR